MDPFVALVVLCAFFGGFGVGYWCFVLTVKAERRGLSELTTVDPQTLIDQKPGPGWW